MKGGKAEEKVGRHHKLDKNTFPETQALPYDQKYGNSWNTIDL